MTTPADTTPLRLRDAARLAFPMGGVTERTLRREHKRGRLRLYEIGGKYFTTLRDILEMTRACSVAPAVTPLPLPSLPPLRGQGASVGPSTRVDTAHALASPHAALAKL
jgi:hypothetical protein